MTGYVFRTSLKEFLSPNRLAAWLVTVAGVFLIALAWRFLSKDVPEETSFGHLFHGVVLRTAALASAVTSALVVSQEIEAKTFVYWLVRPVPRWQIMLGRLLAAAVASFTVVTLTDLACLTAVFGPIGALRQILLSEFVLLGLGVCAYTGLFVLASLFLSKALIVGLVFAFGWETFVPNMAGDAFYLSILTYLRGAASRVVDLDDPGILEALSGAVSARTAAAPLSWTALVALTTVTWACCLHSFSRREFAPREESD
jgi:ABC-2 type transport system permease protein